MARRLAFRTAAGGVLLLLGGTAAMADPTTLICSNDTRPDFPPKTIDLNEAQNAVTINDPAWTDVTGFSHSASSDGPLAAKFDPKTIAFDSNVVRAGVVFDYVHYTIDRVTAVMRLYSSQGAPYDQAAPSDRVAYQYTCHVGAKQF